MTGKVWRVRIKRLVSRVDGKRRAAVPHGDYQMRELGVEEFEHSRRGCPTFRLSLREIATYLNATALEVPDETFP